MAVLARDRGGKSCNKSCLCPPGQLLIVMLIRWGKSHSQDPVAIFGITNNPFHLIPSYLSNGRQECPLVGVRVELLVQEYSVPAFSRFLLERERNEVPESTFGNVSWFGTKRS